MKNKYLILVLILACSAPLLSWKTLNEGNAFSSRFFQDSNEHNFYLFKSLAGFKIWRGENNEGTISTFIKTVDNEWVECNNGGLYYYTEKSNKLSILVLQDKNRAGVEIKLTFDKCFYKDYNTDWIYIYYGKWVD